MQYITNFKFYRRLIVHEVTELLEQVDIDDISNDVTDVLVFI